MLIKALRGLEDYVHLCPTSSGVAGCVLLIFAYFAPIFPGKSRPSAQIIYQDLLNLSCKTPTGFSAPATASASCCLLKSICR